MVSAIETRLLDIDFGILSSLIGKTLGLALEMCNSYSKEVRVGLLVHHVDPGGVAARASPDNQVFARRRSCIERT